MIEQAIEVAGLMLGSDKSLGYCLEARGTMHYAGRK